jgi:type IV pilus assembly protein PilM
MIFGSSAQIGVSIGTSSIKVAELKKAGKSYLLSHFGVAQLPEGAIVNREIMNHQAVVDALKGLVTQLKLKGKPVCTSLSGAAVIIKKILIEQTPSNELEDAILWEAEQYIPFDINEVVFDYQLINKNGPEGKMEIVLVAVKRAIIDSYVAAITDSGLKPKIMDCDLFALQNSFEANYAQEQGAIALVDIGAASTKFTICVGGLPIYTRDAAIGGKDLTAEIQRHLNLSYQEAEVLKIDGAAQGQLPQEVVELMHMASENISAEIKRSIDFYVASNSGSSVSFVMLAGGASRLPNLSKVVEDSVGLPVQLLNPFNTLTADTKLFTQDYLQVVSGIAAVPVGLALRGFAK